MKKLAFLFIVCLGLVASCGKDNTTTKTETPMQTTITQQLVVDSVRIFSNGNWEFGQKLYFSKNGSITKLGCKMANTGSFRVSLWNQSTSDLIAATTVTITDSTKFAYNSISPISVTANTRYILSLNNTHNGQQKLYYVFRKKATPTSVIFPFTTGSVTYEAQHEASSATSVFPPENGSQSYFSGVSDVQFEFTE